jgi:26S proteasome regulatory subunit N7
MAPYYKSITAVLSFLPQDQELMEKMEKSNADELKRLDERLVDAEKTEGESEISDALKARANYLTKIGDKVGSILFFFILVFIVGPQDRALEAQKLALEKTPGLGSRIDIVLTLVRIGLFFGDTEIVTTNISKAEK